MDNSILNIDSSNRDLFLNNLDIGEKLKIAATLLGFRQMPVSIEQFITDPYYLGDICQDLYPFWKDKLKEIYPTPIHTRHHIIVFKGAIGCIGGETKIRLADNSLKTIKELYESNPSGGFYVYSWDINKNEPKAGLVTGVYNTGVKKIYELTFSIADSDETFTMRCTGDHKFLTDKGVYKEALELTNSDSIRSLYTNRNRNLNSSFYNGYIQFWSDNEHHWRPLHRYIAGLVTSDGYEIHHIDGNKLNNTPNNLQIVENDEHHRIHFIKRNSDGSTISVKISWVIRYILDHHPDFDYSEEQYEIYRSEGVENGNLNYRCPHFYTISEYNLDFDEIKSYAIKLKYYDIADEVIGYNLSQLKYHRELMAERNKASARNDITIERIEQVARENNTVNQWELAKILECSISCIRSRIYSKYPSVFNFYDAIGVDPNHNLISIKEVGEDQVYDMTVENYHNYGIEDQCGNLIFTHNTGKSTVVRVMALYMIHRIKCLKNPHRTFNMMPGKNIKFSFFSYSSGLAQTDFINVLWNWFEMSPYFKELMDNGSLDDIELVTDGTRTNSNIGSDVLFYNLSELNFVNSDKAWEKLDQALKRFDSRFGRVYDYFGHVIIDTSSRGDDSIADQFVNDNPYGDHVYVVNTNQWIVRAHQNFFGRLGWFRVYCGDSLHQPFIESIDKPITADLDPDRIIKVPEELRGDFEFDLITALQDKAGISTNTSDRFFPDTTNLMKCFKLPMYSKDVLRIDFYDKSDKLIYHLQRYIKDIPTDKVIYIRYDIGVTGDNTGLAIAYFDHWEYYNINNQKFRQPYIKVPLAVAINRYENQETPIYQLEEFILDLDKQFEIGCFSADQFASRQLLQDLTLAKIKNRYISVDRTDTAYIFLKNQSNHGLIEYPDNKLLKFELGDLRHINGVVDHTPSGSKDIADAVAGAVYSLYEDMDNASKLSNKYKVEIQSQFMQERAKTSMDTFQNMLEGLY